MTPKQLIDQAFELLISLERFLYEWTLGLIAQAASIDPATLDVIGIILFVLTLVFTIGFAFALLVTLVVAFVRPAFYETYWVRYHKYFYISGVVAWICAFILVYLL
jgi:hypothetical protein